MNVKEVEKEVLAKIDLLIAALEKDHFDKIEKGCNVRFRHRIAKKRGNFIVTGSLKLRIDRDKESE